MTKNKLINERGIFKETYLTGAVLFVRRKGYWYSATGQLLKIRFLCKIEIYSSLEINNEGYVPTAGHNIHIDNTPYAIDVPKHVINSQMALITLQALTDAVII